MGKLKRPRSNALRDRRSAPLRHPLDLPDVGMFIDAGDAYTVTDAGAGAVSSWADQSVNANPMTEATNRPTTGTQTAPNGRNVIDFDGTNDKLNATNFAMNVSSKAITWFAVMKWDATGTGKCVLGGIRSGTTIPYQCFQVENNGGNYQVVYGTGSAAAGALNYIEMAFPSPGTTAYKRYVGTVDNLVGPRLWINGTRQTLTAVGSGLMSPSGFLSADATPWKPFVGWRTDGFFWDGKLASVGMCGAALPDWQLERIDQWLGERWGIA